MKYIYGPTAAGLCMLVAVCYGTPLLSASSKVQEQNPNSFPRTSELGSLSRRYRITLRGQLLPTSSPQTSTTIITTTDNSSNKTVNPPPATLSFSLNVTDNSARPQASDSSTTDSVVAAPSVEKVSFVAWPLRRRPVSRKFRPRYPTSTTRRPQVKLLIRPRPVRPAMYSLDGFVPRPSLKKIFTTTETPAERSFRGKFDLQALGSVQKKRKVKFRNDLGPRPEDKKKFRGRDQHRKKRPVTRHNAFARKGEAGKDFPIYVHVPNTGFDCTDKSGMYADPQAGCQAWHLCPGGGTPHRHSFLCPNGTIFSQNKGICDWWYNVDCTLVA